MVNLFILKIFGDYAIFANFFWRYCEILTFSKYQNFTFTPLLIHIFGSSYVKINQLNVYSTFQSSTDTFSRLCERIFVRTKQFMYSCMIFCVLFYFTTLHRLHFPFFNFSICYFISNRIARKKTSLDCLFVEQT